MRQSRPALRRVAAVTTAALAVGITPFVAAAPASAAAPTELFISEYVEGSSNNKALEIYNGTGATVDLAAAGYNVQVFANGGHGRRSHDRPHRHASPPATSSSSPTARRDAAILAPGRPARAAAPTGTATTPSCCARARTVLDVIGQVGVGPRHRVGHRPHLDRGQHAPPQVVRHGRRHERRRRLRPRRPVGRLRRRHVRRPRQPHRRRRPGDRRRPERHLDDPGRRRARTSRSTRARRSPSPSRSTPQPGRSRSRARSRGAKALAVTGGPTTFTLDPSADFALGDACTLTVVGCCRHRPGRHRPAGLAWRPTSSCASRSRPPTPARPPPPPIPAIQGSGDTAAITGPVTTRGVVVGDYEGAVTGPARLLHPGPEGRRRPRDVRRHLRLRGQQRRHASSSVTSSR